MIMGEGRIQFVQMNVGILMCQRHAKIEHAASNLQDPLRAVGKPLAKVMNTDFRQCLWGLICEIIYILIIVQHSLLMPIELSYFFFRQSRIAEDHTAPVTNVCV